MALITVDADGETTIVVVPGANEELQDFELPPADAVLCQQEIPAEAISAWQQAAGLFCLNAAPARRIPVDPDLAVVNRFEFDSLARTEGSSAVTLGAEGGPAGGRGGGRARRATRGHGGGRNGGG